MNDGLAIAIMILSLLAGAWCSVAAARNRWVDLTHLAALGLVEVALVIQAAIVVVRMAAGDRPVEFATFIGYLLSAVLTLPAAVGLGFMEKTRWGAVIMGAAAVVVAVLQLRLQQLWVLR